MMAISITKLAERLELSSDDHSASTQKKRETQRILKSTFGIVPSTNLFFNVPSLLKTERVSILLEQILYRYQHETQNETDSLQFE